MLVEKRRAPVHVAPQRHSRLRLPQLRRRLPLQWLRWLRPTRGPPHGLDGLVAFNGLLRSQAASGADGGRKNLAAKRACAALGLGRVEQMGPAGAPSAGCICLCCSRNLMVRGFASGGEFRRRSRRCLRTMFVNPCTIRVPPSSGSSLKRSNSFFGARDQFFSVCNFLLKVSLGNHN